RRQSHGLDTARWLCGSELGLARTRQSLEDERSNLVFRQRYSHCQRLRLVPRAAGEFFAHDASAASAGERKIAAVQAVQIVPAVQNIGTDSAGLMRELNHLNGA